MIDSEEFAKQCFESVAAPKILRKVVEQSHGEHDFDVMTPTGICCGALEVTSAVNHAYVRINSAIFGEKHGGETIPRVQCAHDWVIHPELNSDIKKVRVRADAYLADVEAAGLDDFHSTGPSSRHPSVQAMTQDLRLSFGMKVTTSMPGSHWISSPSITAWVDSTAVNQAVLSAAARPDNLRKLSCPEHLERHLFVFVDSSSMAAWSALVSREIAEPLSVDAAITHIWVATHSGTKSKGIVWCAKNGDPWERHEVMVDEAADS